MMEKNKSRGFLPGIMNAVFADRTRGKDPAAKNSAAAAASRPPIEIFKDFDRMCAELRDQALALRPKETERRWASPEEAAFHDENLKKKRIEEIHSEIRREILEMHRKLNTGLTESQLETALETMIELAEFESGKSDEGIEGMVKLRAAQRLVSECLPVGLEVLLALGKRQGVKWPDPSGLPPWADDALLEKARRHEIAEVRSSFLSSEAAKVAERIFGVVSVWGESYPAPESTARQKLILSAVGFGITAVLIARARNLIRADSAVIADRVAEILRKQNEELASLLAAGVSDPALVDKLLSASAGLYNEVVPEIVWQHVSATVSDEASRIVGASTV